MLKISELKLGYGGKAVLNLAKFSVANGEHTLLSGKSGSGKTTLLYALSGLLKPLAGSIEIAGTEITNLSGSKLDKFRGENIGIVFQTLHMIAAVTVLDNILVAPFMGGKSLARVDAVALLKSLGIEDLANRKPSEISHGQAQRVAIARAAANSPKLLLADEPTSALDDESAEKVVKLLFEIAEKSGATLVVASHDGRIKKHFKKTLNVGGANE